MSNVATADTSNPEASSRRLLIGVAVAALIVVLVALTLAFKRTHSIPFDPKLWATGRNQFSTGNPRILMKDEVIVKLVNTHPTEKEVLAMLGKPGSEFEIVEPGGIIHNLSAGPSNQWTYLLGVKPKTFVDGRRVSVLVVYFMPMAKSLGDVEYAYEMSIDYPPGCTLITSKPVSTTTVSGGGIVRKVAPISASRP